MHPSTIYSLEDNLKKLLSGLSWQIDYDDYGQVIINTGLVREGDRLIPLDEPDYDEEFKSRDGGRDDDHSPGMKNAGWDD